MRDIVMNCEDFRHIAKAASNYRNGRDRLEDTVLALADHIRNGRRHIVDSLAAGEHAKWNADDALMEELIVQVLVAVQIVCENKTHVKYRLRETMTSEACKRADELFESRKDELINAEHDEWLAFNSWRQQQAQRNTKVEVKKSKGGHK